MGEHQFGLSLEPLGGLASFGVLAIDDPGHQKPVDQAGRGDRILVGEPVQIDAAPSLHVSFLSGEAAGNRAEIAVIGGKRIARAGVDGPDE